MMRDEPCIHCRMSKADHHAYEAKQMPDGCTCNPRDWGAVKQICRRFKADADGMCLVCEHDESCHPRRKA